MRCILLQDSSGKIKNYKFSTSSATQLWNLFDEGNKSLPPVNHPSNINDRIFYAQKVQVITESGPGSFQMIGGSDAIHWASVTPSASAFRYQVVPFLEKPFIAGPTLRNFKTWGGWCQFDATILDYTYCVNIYTPWIYSGFGPQAS